MKTMNEFLTAVANGITSDETVDFAKNELAKRATANAKSVAKRNDKWYEENGVLLRAVETLLRTANHPLTCAEIVAKVDGIDNTSKATAIVKRIEGIKITDVQSDKRIVKAYSL